MSVGRHDGHSDAIPRRVAVGIDVEKIVVPGVDDDRAARIAGIVDLGRGVFRVERERLGRGLAADEEQGPGAEKKRPSIDHCTNP